MQLEVEKNYIMRNIMIFHSSPNIIRVRNQKVDISGTCSTHRRKEN